MHEAEVLIKADGWHRTNDWTELEPKVFVCQVVKE